MCPLLENDEYNLNRIIVKPLYFGLTTNVLVPMALLLICYYYENNCNINNSIGNFANSLFYIIGFLSISQSGLAMWWRGKLFSQPMIKRKEDFEQDFIISLMKKIKPVFLLIAVISLYGFIYFFLTGRFKEAVFFVVFSFLVFQIVRPRYGFIRKLIDSQKKLVERGTFLNS